MDSRKVYSRDFLQCGEIITVVTIKLCKRKFFSFFIKIVKGCTKETGSNFVLLSQSKNTIEWFNKTFGGPFVLKRLEESAKMGGGQKFSKELVL